MTDLPYEERVVALNLVCVQQPRGREDVTVVYKVMMGRGYCHREHLLLWGTRGHGKILTKGTCRIDIKKNTFPQISLDA